MKLRRIVIILGIVAVFLWLLLPGSLPVERGSVLVVDLEGPYVEAVAPSLLSRLIGDQRRTFVSLLSELRKAERDDRLAAVVLRIRGLDVGWGTAQEMRSNSSSARCTALSSISSSWATAIAARAFSTL